MQKLKRIITFMGCLLLLGLSTNCTHKTRTSNVGRIKSELIEEERMLIEKLKEKIGLTSKQLEQFKASLRKQKNEESVEDIDNDLALLETLKEAVESNDEHDRQVGLVGLNSYLQEHIPELYTIRCCKTARPIIDNQILLLQNTKQQVTAKYAR
jgi:hypothetical protein